MMQLASTQVSSIVAEIMTGKHRNMSLLLVSMIAFLALLYSAGLLIEIGAKIHDAFCHSHI